MAFRQILDSDVDRLTALAIKGVNSFISLYEDERTEEPVLAAGPGSRAATREPARAHSPTRSRVPARAIRKVLAKPAKSLPGRRPRI